VVWDLPQPVRTAETAITGTWAVSMVCRGPSSSKLAPAASAREARCITWAVGNVAVGENHLVDPVGQAELLQFALIHNGDALRVEGTRQGQGG
jgi:hypothetical protein